MPAGPMHAEVDARRERDSRALQCTGAETLAVVVERRAVRVNEESAARVDGHAKAQRPQRGDQEIAPRLEREAPRLEDLQRLRLEARQRCVL